MILPPFKVFLHFVIYDFFSPSHNAITFILMDNTKHRSVTIVGNLDDNLDISRVERLHKENIA